MNCKNTWLYLVNGVVFWLIFGVFRVGLYGAGLWHMWRTRYIWASPSVESPLGMRMFAGALVIGYLLQLWWFPLIGRSIYRHIKRADAKRRK
jgi:hypothetical protein